MYRPPSKIRQRGGQYVSSATNFNNILTLTAVTFSTFSTMGVAENVLSTLEGRAGIEPDADLTQLEVNQLESLIKEIDKQIVIDNELIRDKWSTITGINVEIDTRPDGLQWQYDEADKNYNSTLTELNKAASAYSTNLSTYNGRQAELALLGQQSSFTISSITGYEAQYSSILRQLPAALEDYTTYSTSYGRQLETYNNYVRNYSTTLYNYDSTIQALKYNSTLFSVATYEYVSTSILYSTLNADYSTYMMSVVFPSQFQLRSTQTYYSSIVYRISTQQRNLNSTIDVLTLARMDLSIATARKACEVAVATEVSTIIMFDFAKTTKTIIDAQLLRDPNNEALKQQKVSADTTFNTLSMMASSATEDRLIKCTNQSTISQTILQSTLAYYDWRISTAAMYLADAKYRESCVISTINGISTNVSRTLIQERQVISTMSSFSTLYIRELGIYNHYSSIVAGYDFNAFNLSTQLISTLSVLSYYINFSTMYALSTGIYKANYNSFSTLEWDLRMSIASYNLKRSSLTSSISGIDIEIGTLDSDIFTELQNLKTNGPQFYEFKRQEMNDDIDSYKYTVSEISATVGMTVAELVIKKVDNIGINSRNNLKLTLRRQLMSASEQTDITTDIQARSQQNSKIDTLLTTLNPLEIKFRDLLQLVEEERNLKTGTGGFILAKAALFDDEWDYYNSNRSSEVLSQKIAGGYNVRFNAMNTILENIRAKILARDNLYTEIRNTLQNINVRDVISAILGGDPRFPDTDNVKYRGLIITLNGSYMLDEVRNPTTLSEFSVIPSLPASQ